MKRLKPEEEFFQLKGATYAYSNILKNDADFKQVWKKTLINQPIYSYFKYFNATNLLMDFFFNEAKEERHQINKIHFYAFENDPKEEIYKKFTHFLQKYVFEKEGPFKTNDYISQFFFIFHTDQEAKDLIKNLNLQRHSLMTVPYFKKSFSKALEHRDLIDSYTKEWILINLLKAFCHCRQKNNKQVPRIHKFVIEKNDFLKLPEISKDLFHKNLLLTPQDLILLESEENAKIAYFEALDKIDEALKVVYHRTNNLYSKELKFATTLDFSNRHYDPPRDPLEYSLNTLKCELYLSKTSHYFVNFLNRDIYVNAQSF
ncbi:hypothetical protein KVE05_00630 [Helicobacter pylori]|nr:hypothetical protein KVE05_00630 [Helicobacter pylori]